MTEARETLVVARHVFGCRQGYRTLAASPDVTPQDVRELESFKFGQTDDPRYLQSLASEPAYWSRPLRSGKRAVTRVLAGEPDENGRATLLLVSAVVTTADWVEMLRADCGALLAVSDLWKWTGANLLQPVPIRVESAARPVAGGQVRERVLELLAAVENSGVESRNGIVTTETECPPESVPFFARMLPTDAKAAVSYAVRSLSDGMSVTVNCLAAGVASNRLRRLSVGDGKRFDPTKVPYTAALAHFWTAGAEPPWTFVENCGTFGQARNHDVTRKSPGPTPPIATPTPLEVLPVRKRRFPTLWHGLIVLLIAVTAATGFFVYHVITMKEKRRALVAQVDAFLQQHPTDHEPLLPPDGVKRQAILTEAAERRSHLDAALAIAPRDEGLRLASKRLFAWQAAAREQDLGECTADLAQVSAFFAQEAQEHLRITTDLFAKLKRMKSSLESVSTRLAALDPGNNSPDAAELRASVEQCAVLLEQWKIALDSLQGRFDEHFSSALRLVEKDNLRVPPESAMEHLRNWGDALSARSELREALRIWPDHPKARELAADVDRWIERAEKLAFVHFEELVKEAKNGDKWRRDDAEDFWNRYREIARAHDAGRADELRTELDKVEASTQPASQSASGAGGVSE